MDDIINGLCSKAGISQEQARQVVDYLKQNADKLPQLLGQAGVGGKLGEIGSKFGFGGDKR
jgi:hypothetical protein